MDLRHLAYGLGGRSMQAKIEVVQARMFSGDSGKKVPLDWRGRPDRLAYSGSTTKRGYKGSYYLRQLRKRELRKYSERP